jgi:hypothetical protein
MRLLAPGVLWIAVAAAAAVLVAHLMAWRRPRPRPLPTARFLPAASLPSRFRRVEPGDVVVLLLRVAAVLSLGLAVAGPVMAWRADGVGRVIVADRSRAVASASESRDSIRALAAGAAEVRLVWFDSVARPAPLTASLAEASTVAARGNLAAGLVAGLREGAELRARLGNVEVVVVSPAVAEEGSAALQEIASVWDAPLRLVRIAAATPPATATPPGPVLPPPPDPIGAAAWVAWGGRPAHLRLVRAAPTGGDSAFAREGGALVVWPPAADSGATVAAVATERLAAIGRWSAGAGTLDGTPVARWHDGRPAASERSLGRGCIRDVAIGVPDRGDVVLRTSFTGLVRTLTQPCVVMDLRPMPERELEWLRAGAQAYRAPLPEVRAPSVWMQRTLLLLGVVFLGLEWWWRGRRARGPAAMPITAEARRVA